MPPANNFSSAELVTFDGAVAGHDGVLSDPTNTMIIKPCTPAEIAFYETARAFHPAFAAFIPAYMGQLALAPPEQAALLDASASATAATTTPVPTDKKGRPLTTNLSIVLANATAPFARANILDVKLGAQLWDDAAEASKRERLAKVAAETTSGSLGFRIAGMRIWSGAREGGYRDYGKMYGRAFTADNVKEGFEEYLGLKIAPGQGKRVAKRFRDEVERLRVMLEGEESRMVGASMLFVYEGDRELLKELLDGEERAGGGTAATTDDANDDDANDDDDDDDDLQPVSHKLKLIDFAHARFTPGLGPDENALQGVRSVLCILDKILAAAD